MNNIQNCDSYIGLITLTWSEQNRGKHTQNVTQLTSGNSSNSIAISEFAA
jgi:hypothetical protein